MAKIQDFVLNTVLTAQTKEFQAGVAAANAQMTRMKKTVTSSSDSMTASFKKFGASLLPVVSVAAVGAAVISFGKSSVAAAETSEKANRRLLFSLNGNTTAYGELIRQADALRLATGVSGSAIKGIQQLGAGAGYSVDRVKKLTAASVELASKTGMDLQAAYLQLNVTLSGSVGRLKRIDPEFATLTKTQLKNGAAIDLVIAKYGGMAAISATSSEKLSSDWTKFSVSFGKNLLGGRNGLLDFADSMLRSITPSENLAASMEKERAKITALTESLMDHNLPLEVRKTLLIQLRQLAPEVVKGINAEKISIGQLTTNLTEYNRQAVIKIGLERQGSAVAAATARVADLTSAMSAKSVEVNAESGKILAYITKNGTDLEKVRANAVQSSFSVTHDAGKRYNQLYEIYKKGNGVTMDQTLYNVQLSGSMADLKGQYNTATYILDKYTKSQAEATVAANKAGVTYNKTTKEDEGNANVPPPAKAGKIKAENAVQKLEQIGADLEMKLAKEVAVDEIAQKNAEVDAFIEGEKRKIMAVQVTDALQIAAKRTALAQLNSLQERMKTGGSVSKMGQILPANAKTTSADANANQGLSAAMPNSLNGIPLMLDKINSAMMTTSTGGKNMWKGINMGAGSAVDNIGAVSDSFGGLASIMGEQTVAYKAFAIAQAIMNTFLAATGIMASTSPLGPVAMAISVASTVAMGLANVAKIGGAFAGGGIVPGASFSGDRVHAMVNSGEMILNKSQQGNMFTMLNSGGSPNGGGEVKFRIDGTTLVGVLANHNRRQSRIG